MEQHNIANAIVRLEHERIQKHQVHDCLKARVLGYAAQSQLTINQAIGQAEYAQCYCHGKMSREEILDYIRDPSYKNWIDHPPVKKRLKPDIIYVFDGEGEVRGEYYPSRRGRELVERHVKAYKDSGYALFGGLPLVWTTGRLGDYFLDSELLPEDARIPIVYREGMVKDAEQNG